MKRIVCFIITLGLVGCGTKLVYKPAPKQVIPVAQSMQASGTVTPWNLDFTAVVYPQTTHVRVVVLSVVGIKLVDMDVFKDRAEVYFKQEKFPTVALRAFVRFVQATFVETCPSGSLIYKDKQTRSIFQVQLQGETLCP